MCVSTWGEESDAGQPVAVSLNAASFGTRAGSTIPRFFYYGLHPPAIVQAYFSIDATTILIRFDAQATNRAGMNGIGPCNQVLDDATSLQLQGTATAPALCDWIDDSTLFVQLTYQTSATGGMAITLRPNVLWPASWSPVDCNGVESMCASNQTYTINQDFPCDLRETDARELCVQPEAIGQGPSQISSCPGTSITLDGSRSLGGGIKALTYNWRANPLSCDK